MPPMKAASRRGGAGDPTSASVPGARCARITAPNGDAWNFLPHDLARSKAYRWGEDGIAGICDRYQLLVFALAFWNGRDPILKERLFGLNGSEANHGEDVKEYYFYLDNTPTHSYMKLLYKYPQGEFPYWRLIEENRSRGPRGPEFELLDTGVFDDDRYFDIFVEYAKAGPEDICIRIEAFNRGPEAATLHLLPHLWFRNTWAWTRSAGTRTAHPSRRHARKISRSRGRFVQHAPACESSIRIHAPAYARCTARGMRSFYSPTTRRMARASSAPAMRAGNHS